MLDVAFREHPFRNRPKVWDVLVGSITGCHKEHSAHFVLPTPAKFVLGALIKPFRTVSEGEFSEVR
jgi:hypothetical protein